MLFDHYRSLDLLPAAGFALPSSASPAPGSRRCSAAATSPPAPPGKDRLPEPYLPPGLRLDPLEGAGEVQTPLLGEPPARLRVGDRVYMRHAKAGELCERFDTLHLVEGDGSSTRCRPTAARARRSSESRPLLRRRTGPSTRSV